MSTTLDEHRTTNTGLQRALAASGGGRDLESVTRPLLVALQELTGLSSTYLTSIDFDEQHQEIVYAVDDGEGIQVPEGLQVPWADTLCRRAMAEGVTYVDDVPVRWAESEAAAALGIQTYATQPVLLPDGEVFGTLCGVSGDRVPASEDVEQLLQVFSRIIADTVARERALQASQARVALAEERLRERAQFLAVAEHKCKTPLAVIVGWSKLMQSGQLDDDRSTEAVRAIVSSADRLSDHLTEMMSEATAQVMASEMHPVTLDVGSLLAEIGSELDATTDTHRVAVEVGESLQVVADERAVRIVVEHLVENAINYSPGADLVQVTAERTPAGRVAIRVRDHGMGLPSGVDIFAPFVRGDSDRPGTGLGLHIVRSLVHAMDGDVTATQAEPGAAFTVLLSSR